MKCQRLDISDSRRDVLSSAVKQHSNLTRLKQLSLDLSVPVYLGGGGVRDLLLGSKSPADFDCIVECSTEQFVAFTQEYSKRFKAEGSSKSAVTADLMRADAVEPFVLAFDFTVNTLVFDLRSETLIDFTGVGYQDLEGRVLRPPWLPTFLSGALQFVRAYRFAASLGFSFHPELARAVRQYRTLCRLGNAHDDCAMFVEFVRLLSEPSASPQILRMLDDGVLELVMPEISMHGDASKTLGDLITRFESALGTERLTSLCEFSSTKVLLRSPLKERSVTFRWNALSFARLAILLHQSIGRLLAIEPAPVAHWHGEQFENSSRQSQFRNLKARYAGYQPVIDYISQVERVLLSYQSLATSTSAPIVPEKLVEAL